MTEKQYYQNQYLKKFTANIINKEEIKGGCLVELDRTAFYPEGGGQPADLGKIAGVEVRDVFEKDGSIYHLLEGCPDKEQDLECFLNWERRFDHMQQHTGQHLLSAIFSQNYRAETVGFHLGEEYVSIDLNRELLDKDLIEVENKVNQYIYDNLPIEILYPEREELESLKLRKEISREENIRIVRIGEIDYSPCGGTHLQSTGELGIIKITNASNYKGGLRVEFLCGQRALKDYQAKNNLASRLREMLSVSNEQIINEVERLQANIKEREQLLLDQENRLLTYRAAELLESASIFNGIRVIGTIRAEEDFKKLRYLAGKMTAEDDVIAIIGQKDEETARLLMARSENITGLDMNELIKKPLTLIAGRGGGNSLQAQGGGSNPLGLSEAVELAIEETKKVLGGESITLTGDTDR